MPNVSDKTLRQVDALNNWLGDVYGEETRISTLLIDAGFSEAEIEQIKREHLGEFLQAVMDIIDGYPDIPSEGRNTVMVQHYGLIDGKPQTLNSIGHSVGLCRERIRQLVNRRMDLHRDPPRQARFRDDFAAIGRQLLDK